MPPKRVFAEFMSGFSDNAIFARFSATLKSPREAAQDAAASWTRGSEEWLLRASS